MNEGGIEKKMKGNGAINDEESQSSLAWECRSGADVSSSHWSDFFLFFSLGGRKCYEARLIVDFVFSR